MSERDAVRKALWNEMERIGGGWNADNMARVAIATIDAYRDGLGYVTVRRDDLAAALRDRSHMREILQQRRVVHVHLANQDQVRRLRAALKSEEDAE